MEKFKSFEELPLVLNANDLSKALGVSIETGYQLIHSKGFPTVRIGERRYIVPKDAFIEWMKNNTGRYIERLRGLRVSKKILNLLILLKQTDLT